MNRDLTYVNQILDAINKIQEYTVEGRDVFYETIIIQDAVMRNIEIIGEIAKKISDDFKVKYDAVPWRKMVGIRDVLINDYDSIDMSVDWHYVIIQSDNNKSLIAI